MADQYYLLGDSETGGLSTDQDILTLYLAIVGEDFKIKEELDLKLKPDNRLPLAEAGALKVNGIDLHKHIADPETITYSEANTKITAMIKKYLKKKSRYSNIRPIFYNASFDIGFIQKHVVPFVQWDSMISYNVVDPKVVVNFLKDSKWLPPDLGSLISAVKYFNIPMGTAHTAKADSLATLEVYKKILELMESKKSGGNDQSVDLISLLEAE
jgi:DNA polymerase III alpha subunit (gram-positive type)